MAHADKNAPDKGVFYRQKTYRKNGYDVIKGDSGKNGIYKSDDNIRDTLKRLERRPGRRGVKQYSDEHVQAYYFDYGTNFQLGRAPYANQAHHLIPVSTFTDPPFTASQQELLRKVKYNVNNGDNIIFLPSIIADADFHNLPVHNGDHPKYTNLVKKDAQELSDTLQKAVDEDADHKTWDPPGDLVNQLKNLEEQYWDFLKNAGKKSVNKLKKPKKRSAGP